MPDITDLTELNETPADSDEFLVYDVSAGTGNSKKVTLENLLGDAVREGGDHDLGTSTITDLTTTNSQIGFTGGATITKIIAGSGSVAPSEITTLNAETVTLTVTGALTTDYLLSWAFTGALPDGLECQAWISAADTVSFRFYNSTSGSISGATYTARVMVLRSV